jgi:glucan 1,6-alpha-glucosidase
VIFGEYELIDTAENVFAYTRSLDGKTILVVANMSDEENAFDFDGDVKDTWIHNYNEDVSSLSMNLKPWEAFAVEIS